MTYHLHPIPCGLWCVPSALVALTGADFESVIHPALNRHSRNRTLTGLVTGATDAATLAVLEELGYRARRYRGDNPAAQVRTWARRAAERYPGRPVLLTTRTHALVTLDGRVYDNHLPHGPAGDAHSWSRVRVEAAYLIERRS